MADNPIDQELTRVLLVLESHPKEIVTWTPVAPRWVSSAACMDFARGEKWDGMRVKRALVVDQAI